MRVRFLLIVGLVVASLVQAGPGRAQAPAPNPESLAAAKELITVMRLTDQLKTLLPIIMQGLKPAIVQNRPAVEKDYDALLPLMLGAVNARTGSYVEEVAVIYARAFTAGELRDITAFYRTPTGTKMLEKLPSLMQDSVQVGQRFGQGLAVELEGRIKDELRKKGHNI